MEYENTIITCNTLTNYSQYIAIDLFLLIFIYNIYVLYTYRPKDTIRIYASIYTVLIGHIILLCYLLSKFIYTLLQNLFYY